MAKKTSANKTLRKPVKRDQDRKRFLPTRGSFGAKVFLSRSPAEVTKEHGVDGVAIGIQRGRQEDHELVPAATPVQIGENGAIMKIGDLRQLMSPCSCKQIWCPWCRAELSKLRGEYKSLFKGLQG